MTGKLRNTIVATVAALAITGTALTPVLAAAAHKDQVVEASKSGAANPNLKLSQDGYTVMRSIRAARVAIFNGDTDLAKKFVSDAQEALTKVKSDDSIVKKTDKTDEAIAANWVPIDGQLVVADNFVATPEKAAHIAKGNQKIKEGKANEAIEELKLANVDVGFTRILMPLGETEAHLNLAAKQIKGEDYYEANLALKAAEDGLNVETAMLVEAPKTQKTSQADTAKTTASVDKTAPTKTN